MTFKEVVGMNGPFARIGSLLFDMIYVNLLWLIFGGPALVLVLQILPLPDTLGRLLLITLGSAVALLFLGTSTTASFAALGKRYRHEESYTFQDFWKSYKQNLKQGILLTLILGLIITIIIYSVWLEFNNRSLFGNMFYVILPVQIFVGAELLFVILYAFALLARFEMTTKDVLKYSFLMANKHLPSTLLLVVMLVAVLAATFLWNLGVGLFAFGVFFYLASGVLERVFKNYMPEEEEMPEEDADYLTDDTKTRNSKQVATASLDKERQALLEKYTGKKRDE